MELIALNICIKSGLCKCRRIKLPPLADKLRGIQNKNVDYMRHIHLYKCALKWEVNKIKTKTTDKLNVIQRKKKKAKMKVLPSSVCHYACQQKPQCCHDNHMLPPRSCHHLCQWRGGCPQWCWFPPEAGWSPGHRSYHRSAVAGGKKHNN